MTNWTTNSFALEVFRLCPYNPSHIFYFLEYETLFKIINKHHALCYFHCSNIYYLLSHKLLWIEIIFFSLNFQFSPQTFSLNFFRRKS